MRRPRSLAPRQEEEPGLLEEQGGSRKPPGPITIGWCCPGILGKARARARWGGFLGGRETDYRDIEEAASR